ncbi:hypothetical protein KY465_16430 [Pseudohoeflea sp. DP4N28-3]|uniref:Uncharacterized protein n=1 Tax=Pseudohoeflea coraliihabitans TaxID=2860393 RepID=A0ABS6WSE4_9HYPH|nr:hypothetical protein [Pseudohoeflea sp. DP4N28-3]MBW3098869.1 hypothetical protein [Pseudohoeflea sp. DP4N28-3]
MRMILAAGALALAAAGAATAQTSAGSGQSNAGSVGDLVADGYEIRAAVPNGSKYVVFLQKEDKAYACEFITLSQSRCGEIK